MFRCVRLDLPFTCGLIPTLFNGSDKYFPVLIQQFLELESANCFVLVGTCYYNLDRLKKWCKVSINQILLHMYITSRIFDGRDPRLGNMFGLFRGTNKDEIQVVENIEIQKGTGKMG